MICSRNNILIDVDHTLSAAWPRDGMIGVNTWDEYHSAGQNDLPIDDIRSIVNCMWNAGFKIIVMTARPEKFRELTMSWMVRHGILVDEILMRPDEAFRPSPEIKLELALARFPDIKNQVAMLLEDRQDVIDAFKPLGITCLQVHGRREP